jgi:GNAT superfamily N-acetyltransferase
MTAAIRPAVAADAAALFALVQGFATSYRPEAAGFETCLRRVLADEAAWLAVAQEGSELVGYCLGFEHPAFYASAPVAWIEEVMVAADQRRRGVGAALICGFEVWAAGRGARLSALATRRAAPFYRALGYVESASYFRRELAAGDAPKQVTSASGKDDR